MYLSHYSTLFLHLTFYFLISTFDFHQYLFSQLITYQASEYKFLSRIEVVLCPSHQFDLSFQYFYILILNQQQQESQMKKSVCQKCLCINGLFRDTFKIGVFVGFLGGWANMAILRTPSYICFQRIFLKMQRENTEYYGLNSGWHMQDKYFSSYNISSAPRKLLFLKLSDVFRR